LPPGTKVSIRVENFLFPAKVLAYHLLQHLYRIELPEHTEFEFASLTKFRQDPGFENIFYVPEEFVGPSQDEPQM